MYQFTKIFRDNWQKFKRYYTLKHNRPFRGKGTIERSMTVDKRARRAMWLFILILFLIIIFLLIFDSIRQGVGIMTELQYWVHSLLKMKVPATDPRKV